MTKIAVLFTCFNRIEKTRACIDFVECAAKSAGVAIEWFITDGGSSDGTVSALSKHNCNDNNSTASSITPVNDSVVKSNITPANDSVVKDKIHFQVEDGVFYSQGMRKCMEMLDASESSGSFDYIMLVNDDVEFFEDFLVKMLDYSAKIGPNKVIVGATCACPTADQDKVIVGATCACPNTEQNENCDMRTKSMSDSGITGNRIQSYGGVRYKCKPGSSLSIKYSMVSIDDSDKSCDTFNANCVLIPWKIYSSSPRFDEHFIHGLGDFDYGLSLKGEKISSDFYVGICDNNSKAGTWMDATLPVSERLSKLNSIKGAPTKQWFYYLRKHFGIAPALIHSMSPYIRILLGK